MALKKLVLIILAFELFSATYSSMVKLNNGGYEDIIIAINPRIPEDMEIIEKIKDMVKEATHYLFSATKKRLYIKSVKILIPFSWSASPNYTKSQTETYSTADVVIETPHLKYGDDPYTLQYGKCGEPGQYIHFTPNFLKDDTLIDVYGPRGRVFVHEWAHFRWGVYDEYSTETPYYIASNLKVEATRCSTDILGVNMKIPSQCAGNSCKPDYCNFNASTGLYEDDCFFLPEKDQFTSESLMYLQALPSVSQFCDDNSHNKEAPNLQNSVCGYRSTWDVVKNSGDVNRTVPMDNFIVPEPSFTLLQHKDRIITLVLDVSGSMGGYSRSERLYQAADVFLIQIAENNSYVGLVQFESKASILSELVKITGEGDRLKLKALVPKRASGGTNICEGIRSGIKVNQKLDGSASGTELVLLSDGEDNYDTKLCTSEILAAGVILHFIALGPSASEALNDTVHKTGGLYFSASDRLDANGLIDAFSSLVSRNGDTTQQAIQLESKGLLLANLNCLNGTVFIDSTVGNDTFFLVTWQSAVPAITLQDPKGKEYTETHFKTDTASKSSRLQIPGTAERGPWIYSLCNKQTASQSVGITVNSKAADERIPPINVKAHMDKDTNVNGDPMIVYASVSQGLLPVKGAKVTAIIESLTGKSETIELLDNGAGADIVKDDGIYTRYFTSFTEKGRYSLKVRVESGKKSRLVLPKNRALYIPGYVQNGTIHVNPSKPEINEEDLNVGEFSRTASGGSFLVNDVVPGNQADKYKPEKITDLKAKIEGITVVLSWTATGDDLDQGNATRYDLRMDTNPIDLRDKFNNSAQVDISSLKPQQSGSAETFTFIPQNVVIENGVILYFAIVAIDKVSHHSDISNIAQAALVIPTTPAPTTTTPAPTTTTTDPTTTTPATTTTTPATTTTTSKAPITSSSNNSVKLNVAELTLIICSAVIIICLIISITICIVSCHKKPRNPEINL